MSPLNILIIDDNHDLADGLAMILEDEGHQATLAYDGQEGVRKYNEGHFDVVFIDFKMHKMNGVAVLQEIRHKDPFTRVIIMTGYHMEQVLLEVCGGVASDVVILRTPLEIDSVLEGLDQIQKGGIVLVAHGDPDFAGKLSSQLTDHGIENLHAQNVQDVAGSLLPDSVEVLVLNLGLPVIYGLEMYLDLKQRDHSLKTIIVAGYTNRPEDKIDVLRSTEVTGCLFKPFKPEEMLASLSALVAD